MTEDSPPNVPPRTTMPPAEVDSRMVALSLSSMATTLEQIGTQIANQHTVTLERFDELKSMATLAGNMAQRALAELEEIRETTDRLEGAVGRLARSVGGLEQASMSLIETVYPERGTVPPDVELADVVPIRRASTGE